MEQFEIQLAQQNIPQIIQTVYYPVIKYWDGRYHGNPECNPKHDAF